MTERAYCCQLRRKFVLGIIAEDRSIDYPVDVADIVVEWEPKILIRIRFCPFCGTKIPPAAPTRTPV